MAGRFVRMTLVAVLALGALVVVAVAAVGLSSHSGCTTTETTERITGRAQVLQSVDALVRNSNNPVVRLPDEITSTTTKTCR